MSRMFKKTVALWLKMWYYLSMFINVFMNNVTNNMEALGLELDRSIAFGLHIIGAIGARSFYEARDMMLFCVQGATYDEARMKAEDNNTHRLVEAEYAREISMRQRERENLYRRLEIVDRRLEIAYRRLEIAYSEIARGEAVDAVAIPDASIPENHVISLGDSQGEQSAQVTPRCNIDALIVEDRLQDDNAIRVNYASVNENTDSNKSIEQSVVRSTSQIFSAQNKECEQFESDNDIGKIGIDFHKIPNNNDSALSQGLEDNKSERVKKCKDISKHKTQLVTQCKDISKPVLQDRVTGPSYCWETTSSLRKHMAVDAVHKNRAFDVKKIPRQMFINH